MRLESFFEFIVVFMPVINISYYASLRESLGRSSETLDIPAEVTTLGQLQSYLVGLGEPYAGAMAPDRAIRGAVNQQVGEPTTAVSAGDQIAFFPPVTGG